MTRDRVNTYALKFQGGSFWVYELGPDARIKGRHADKFSATTSADCGLAKSYAWPGHSNRTLVKMLAGRLKGQYVGIPQSNLQLVVIP
jgi:hypothetical protein